MGMESEACVAADNKASELFLLNVGLRHACVMSPWLFNLYTDGVMREVNTSVMCGLLKQCEYFCNVKH